MTALVRIVKSGFQIFRRNWTLFSATIAVMAMMLFVLAGLLVFRFLTGRVVEEIQNRMAISIFFDTTVDESGILRARDLLAQLPEVETVEYVSREEAIAEFRDRRKTNVALMRAFEVIGSNPLQASLSVRARNPLQYAAIASFIEKAPFRNQITRSTYIEQQLIIERLNRAIAAIRNGDLFLALALAAIATLVFLNAMRIAIYTFRDEIAIMKFVGASNNFVKGPFVVAGVLAGILAALASFAIFVLLINVSAPRIETFIPRVGINDFLAANLWLVFGAQLALGAVLGMFTSSIAINKYLKV